MSKARLIGFRDSVYTRAARMGLAVVGMDYAYEEVNPFTEEGKARLGDISPFGTVPVFCDDGQTVYETTAILAFLGARAPQSNLVPDAPWARARVLQVQGIVTLQVYQPLVRQVFSHAVYRPRLGLEADPDLARTGMQVAPRVLGALDMLAQGGVVLNGSDKTLADCLLAPMIDYFCLDPPGLAMLARFPALSKWFQAMREWGPFIETRPEIAISWEGAPQ